MTSLSKLALLCSGALLLKAAISEKIAIKIHQIKSKKLSSPVGLLHISDLHSSLYGKDQCELISITDTICPDAILLTGDILDNRVSNANAIKYLKHIGKKYPCFYVCGNHEIYTGLLPEIKELIRSFGITVLEGESTCTVINGQPITISGVDDPYICKDDRGRIWEEQVLDCNKDRIDDVFSILLSHRPEPVSLYKMTDFDLILTGHAHGGQVRIPFILNGLYAPHQGTFPKYAGGRYPLDKNKTMIVSRGLSKYVRPRVFNRPEAVLIFLEPKK